MKPTDSPKLCHLLIKGQFRVWCRPKVVPGDFDVTVYPSKATCASCLTIYRREVTGRKGPFKVSHTGRPYNEHGV